MCPVSASVIPRGAGDRPLGKRDMTKGHPGHIVQGKGVIRRHRGKGRVGDHLQGARAGFLGGLEHQDHGAARRAAPAQQPRHAGKDRHMAVMAALVAPARHDRAMRDIGQILNRQPVQLAAQQHPGPGWPLS